MHRHVVPLVFLAAASVLLAAATPGRADELPPPDAPPYSAVYRMSQRSKVNPQDEWKFNMEDTVTISVNEKKSRWDYKSDGRTTLIERGATTTTFGGKTPPNTAVRSRMPFVPVSWEFGYGTVAAATKAKPEVLGTTTIAGKECTRLTFTSEQYGKPEYCIAKNGVVLRFANASSNAEAVYEAQSVTEAAPDKDRFAIPAGHVIEHRGPIRRNVQIF
jgi:hypothetical protein